MAKEYDLTLDIQVSKQEALAVVETIGTNQWITVSARDGSAVGGKVVEFFHNPSDGKIYINFETIHLSLLYDPYERDY